jgi:hypothetical protein
MQRVLVLTEVLVLLIVLDGDQTDIDSVLVHQFRAPVTIAMVAETLLATNLIARANARMDGRETDASLQEFRAPDLTVMTEEDLRISGWIKGARRAKNAKVATLEIAVRFLPLLFLVRTVLAVHRAKTEVLCRAMNLTVAVIVLPCRLEDLLVVLRMRLQFCAEIVIRVITELALMVRIT